MSQNEDFMLVIKEIYKLHNRQEITLPDGSWGANCIYCDGFVYPCKTIELLVKALHSVVLAE